MKRFTETTKWTGDPWFRKLAPSMKCFWLLLLDCCDAAGVIEPDWELMSFQIGEDVSEDDLPKFGDRIERLPSGKLFLTKFINFQYGRLSPDCKPHGPVFKSLHSNGINLERLSEDYPKGLETLKEKKKDKDTDKVREQDSKEHPDTPSAIPASSSARSPEAERERIELLDIVAAYPRRENDSDALVHLTASVKRGEDPATILSGTRAIAAIMQLLPSEHMNKWTPSTATFFAKERWRDDPKTWLRNVSKKNGAVLPELNTAGRQRNSTIRANS